MSTTLPLETIRLGSEHNGLRMSPRKFDAIQAYDDLHTYELIDGVLVVNPIPLPEQRGPNQLLGYYLLDYQMNHPQGGALDDTLDEEYIRVPNGRRRADRVIWAGLGRQPNVQSDVPAIVVEFVSAGRRSFRRDYEEKRDEYIALGVQEYCVIDRFGRTLTVFQPAPSGIEEQVIAATEIYETTLLSGFQLPLGKLLEAADRWAEA